MRFAALALLVLLLVSCGSRDEGPAPDPIVVYAPGDSSSSLAALLAEFTEATRIQVSVKWGSSADNTDAVIGKKGIPADILITDNAADIWRAADEGALRPIESEALDEVSDLIRDRDGYWTSFGVHPALIVTPHMESAQDAAQVAVCVLSSRHALSRSYIANQIQSRGLQDAERRIRRMVASFDREPFATQDELVDAVRAGDCEMGLVSNIDVEDLTLVERHSFSAATVEAVGVGRHARYPQSAQRFVDWLIRERPVEVPETLLQPVSVAGYRDEEARLLAERAGYR